MTGVVTLGTVRHKLVKNGGVVQTLTGGARGEPGDPASANPGGSTTQVQFNDGGAFGGSSGLAWDKTTNTLILGADVKLMRGAANVLEQRNGTSTQTIRVYFTYIDASNYSRAFMRTTGSSYEFGGEALGTGTALNTFITAPATKEVFFQVGATPLWKVTSIALIPHSLANTYDLGSATTTVRSGYFGTSVVSPIFQTGDNTVSALPASAAGNRGQRRHVTDSSVAASGNFGATVAGGGANVVPVFSTGSAWIIA